MTSVQAERSSTRLFDEPHTLSHALDAHQRGWSVIPLLGGEHPTHGKRPRIRWQRFQSESPSEQHVHNWFSDDCTAYGVVCGLVSNLIVIDFDDADVQAEFIQCFPHLMQTRLVQSGLRGTLHIYLQTDFPVKSCKLRGGDLKAEGGYVVGAGSEIAGGVWEVVHDVPPYAISQDELAEVMTVFGLSDEKPSQVFSTPLNAKSPDDFIQIYRFLARERGSRNEALFRVGCAMRDEGYDLSDVIAILAPIHVKQAPIGSHARETDQQRYAEAERTLHSVFTRSPRPRQKETARRDDASYVPNSLREAILKHPEGTAFLRVYEGLLLTGKSPGEAVTEREALELLSAHGVGRPSVRKALKFMITPSLRLSPHAEADLSFSNTQTKTCVFVPATKGDKSPAHRPTQHYLIPDVDTLCQIFGVEPKGADPITLTDIRTVKTYRAALNRELIRRRPGQYTQSWLGKRLNVTRRTVQRYLKLENIKSRQIIHEMHIEWGSLNLIPTRYAAKRAGFDSQPYFLQDERGKRYPPEPEIAEKLLKQGHGVWLMRRGCNVYWCDVEPLPEIQAKSEARPEPEEHVIVWPDYAVSEVPLPKHNENGVKEAIVPDPEIEQKPVEIPMQKPLPKRSPRFYKKPLPDASDEWFAQKVYQSAGNLQEVEARQLVDKYGRRAVGHALGRMEYLRENDNLRNAAGFMKVAARVAWREMNGFEVMLPKYTTPKKRKGRSTYRDPVKDSIWKSEAYRTWRDGYFEDIWNWHDGEQMISF